MAFHSGCVGRSCYDINAGVRLRLPAHRDHHHRHRHHHHCHGDDIDDDYHHDCGANNDPPYDLKNSTKTNNFGKTPNMMTVFVHFP